MAESGDKMRIQRVTLTNFKGIDYSELNLDGKCTVFYGVNGVGKTTILRS